MPEYEDNLCLAIRALLEASCPSHLELYLGAQAGLPHYRVQLEDCPTPIFNLWAWDNWLVVDPSFGIPEIPNRRFDLAQDGFEQQVWAYLAWYLEQNRDYLSPAYYQRRHQ